ncbi:MAG: CHC2 zinc finger domain-containing protein [Pseudomonadota bacterium]
MSRVTRLKPDIVTLMTKEGMELMQRGKYSWGLCPLHQEKTPSFSVNPERQTFHCFGCQKGGDIIAFIQELKGVSFPDALKYLGVQTGKPGPSDYREAKKWKIVKAFEHWCRTYRNQLCDELRGLDAFLPSVRTEADLEEFGELYHHRTELEIALEVLATGSTEDQFLLFEEVTNGV